MRRHLVMPVTTSQSITTSERLPDTGKIVSAEDAVRLIRTGAAVVAGGFVGIGFAEEIAVALEALYLSTDEQDLKADGKPRNLTLVYAAGQGDGKERGLNHLGHDGLVRRVIGGAWGLGPRLPGHMTRVGLGTYVEPRHGGDKINECTKDDLVELLEIKG